MVKCIQCVGPNISAQQLVLTLYIAIFTIITAHRHYHLEMLGQKTRTSGSGLQE